MPSDIAPMAIMYSVAQSEERSKSEANAMRRMKPPMRRMALRRVVRMPHAWHVPRWRVEEDMV